MCYNDDMIYAYNCAALSAALQKLQNIVRDNEERGLKTIIFCEDRLSLAAERTVCLRRAATELLCLSERYVTSSHFLNCCKKKVLSLAQRSLFR